MCGERCLVIIQQSLLSELLWRLARKVKKKNGDAWPLMGASSRVDRGRLVRCIRWTEHVFFEVQILTRLCLSRLSCIETMRFTSRGNCFPADLDERTLRTRSIRMRDFQTFALRAIFAGKTMHCFVTENPLEPVFGSSERAFVVSEFEIRPLGLV
jgi:hypothetical protein